MLADDDLLRLILAKVDVSPAGWVPLAWLSCADVCRQWRRLMFELPLAWCFEPTELNDCPLEAVKATKLRFRTVEQVEGCRPSEGIVLKLLSDPHFQQQQGSTLSSISAFLPSEHQFNKLSFSKLARSYPVLASMRFEPSVVEDPADSFDAELLEGWYQLRTLELAYFDGADLSQVPHGLHTLRLRFMDLQVSTPD